MSEALAKKLRLKAGQKITVLNLPGNGYFTEFEVSEEFPQSQTEAIVLFVKNLQELKDQTMRLIKEDKVSLGGRLLIAYPKKGNKVFDSYVHRDEIFPALGVGDDGYIQNSDYKFNLMVKLDDIYTIVGIKHVKRENEKKTSVSQHVDDYIKFIPEMEKELYDEIEALAFFRSLTYGYQKNWARYVYSAKKPETQKKRKEEMIELLRRRVKAKNLK